MAYRGKLMRTHALARPYVRRPINHANFTGRAEPNPIETGFTLPADPERGGGSLRQLRLLAVAALALGLMFAVIALIGLRPVPLIISLAVALGGHVTFRLVNRRLP